MNHLFGHFVIAQWLDTEAWQPERAQVNASAEADAAATPVRERLSLGRPATSDWVPSGLSPCAPRPSLRQIPWGFGFRDFPQALVANQPLLHHKFQVKHATCR
jgi:hypothetical protein